MMPLFSSTPNRRRPYLMAHRGNRAICPENTLAAFRQAIADGADILETDLHVTADGAFVCIHDATLQRTTGAVGRVADWTLEEIKRLSASYGRAEYHDERIPTLSELVAFLPPHVALALELKTDRFLEREICRKLSAELDQASVRERSMILSFDLERLRAMAGEAPEVPIGWITLSRPIPLRGVQLLGPYWPLLLINPFYVLLAHHHGQAVCPLDPTPDGRLAWYVWLGCDAVLSDNPAATRTKLDLLTRPPGAAGGTQ